MVGRHGIAIFLKMFDSQALAIHPGEKQAAAMLPPVPRTLPTEYVRPSYLTYKHLTSDDAQCRWRLPRLSEREILS